jgi:hypothetical protein
MGDEVKQMHLSNKVESLYATGLFMMYLLLSIWWEAQCSSEEEQETSTQQFSMVTL